MYIEEPFKKPDGMEKHWCSKSWKSYQAADINQQNARE
jgi:hypothetical protein